MFLALGYDHVAHDTLFILYLSYQRRATSVRVTSDRQQPDDVPTAEGNSISLL